MGQLIIKFADGNPEKRKLEMNVDLPGEPLVVEEVIVDGNAFQPVRDASSGAEGQQASDS